jgi:hypothetical protein
VPAPAETPPVVELVIAAAAPPIPVLDTPITLQVINTGKATKPKVVTAKDSTARDITARDEKVKAKGKSKAAKIKAGKTAKAKPIKSQATIFSA